MNLPSSISNYNNMSKLSKLSKLTKRQNQARASAYQDYLRRQELKRLIEQQKKELYFDNRHSIYGVNQRVKQAK